MKVNVPHDHVPNVEDLVQLCFEHVTGWPARATDVALVRELVGDRRGPEGIEQIVRQTCEYLWDHFAGEPDDPTAEELYEYLVPILEEWYRSRTS